jgi:type IV secretion system protein VirB8
MNQLAAIPIPAEAGEEFFRQQESLHAQHIRSIARGRTAAWWVAGCAVAVAVLEAGAMAALAPLHSVEWNILKVPDSGPVEVLTRLSSDAVKLTINEANARATLAQYVRFREGYAAPEAAYAFRAVSLMSIPQEAQRYAAAVRGGNPDSPQVQFGKLGSIRINVLSVSLLGPGLGQVRFARIEQKDGGTERMTQKVATIGFDWQVDAIMANADRTVNPLGFLVSAYRVDDSQ